MLSLRISGEKRIRKKLKTSRNKKRDAACSSKEEVNMVVQFNAMNISS